MFSAEEVLAAPFQDGWRNTGHRSVKCSDTISYADLDRSPGRASYATSGKAAAIGRSAPESARAHSILLPIAVVRGVSSPRSAGRTRSGPHRPSPTGTAGDRPAERLGDPHRDPVVEPFGRSGRDAGWCRVHRHGHRADSLQGHRPGQQPGVGEIWSDATGNARHDADPFGDEGRQG